MLNKATPDVEILGMRVCLIVFSGGSSPEYLWGTAHDGRCARACIRRGQVETSFAAEADSVLMLKWSIKIWGRELLTSLYI